MRRFPICLALVVALGACQTTATAPGSVTVNTAVAATPSKVIAYVERYCAFRLRHATARSLIVSFGGPTAATASAIATEVCASVAARYASLRGVPIQ